MCSKIRVKYIFLSLLLLLFSLPVFAHGGAGMEAMLVWVYTLLAIMHGVFVLILLKGNRYKALWIVLVSLLFSVFALLLWGITFSMVVNNIPKDIVLLVVSIAGLVAHAVITVWAIYVPIKQYRHSIVVH